jgi:adhesin transport system outer membrane protein
MSVFSIFSKLIVPASLVFLASCQMTDLAENPFSNLNSPTDTRVYNANTEADSTSLSNILSLKEAVSQAVPKINVDAGFAKALAAAVKSDPKVQRAKAEVLRRQAMLGVTKSQLDFQFSGTVYAGIEDVTDKTNGIAAVLSASKVLYDGGQISNAISGEEYAVQSALAGYWAKLNESALVVGKAWVELERYQSLNSLISSRLEVLEPLINQLEQIADAGVGDATQVAVAQRTVSQIRVTETDVQERLAQAELNFIRILGKLPRVSSFNGAIVATAVPKKVSVDMAMSSPGLMAQYAIYMSALQGLQAAKARNNMTVGFETKIQRPFGDSAYDSDESIGFVARKTIFNGGKLESEVLAAQAKVDEQEASVKETYRRGKETVETSAQLISSMGKTIGMARSNAQALRDEIILLRKQLVIGQSTLDSVLSAEARLYDAESKEIHFTAERRISQLGVLSAIGRLSTLVGLDPKTGLN